MSASTSLSSDDLSPLLLARGASGFGNERAFCRCRLHLGALHWWEAPTTAGAADLGQKEKKREGTCAQVTLSKSSMLPLVFNK